VNEFFADRIDTFKGDNSQVEFGLVITGETFRTGREGTTSPLVHPGGGQTDATLKQPIGTNRKVRRGFFEENEGILSIGLLMVLVLE